MRLQQRRQRPTGWGVPLGIGVGAGMGLVVGILVEQPALGIAVGAGLGVVIGAMLTATDTMARDERRRALTTAAAILIAGIAATVWIVLR